MKRSSNSALTAAALLCLLFFFMVIATEAIAQYTPAYFTSEAQREQWIADVRAAIAEAERELAKTESTAAKWLASAKRQTHPDAREADITMYKAWAKLAEDGRRSLEALKQKLQNIPGVRDLEAERREQQRLAEQRAAAQRQYQEQQAERVRQQEAAAARQSEREQQASRVANALMQGFNNMQERNRAWEERQERVRREEEEWNRFVRGSLETDPAPVTASDVPTPSLPPVAAEAEPYVPPSRLGDYLPGDEARKFGAAVVSEVADILAEEFAEGASNLEEAAIGGIEGLLERTYEGIVDDLVDAGTGAAVNRLPEEKQVFIRALNIPLSILTRNWDTIKEAWEGENSLFVNHFKNPMDTFTVQHILDEASRQAEGFWPSGSR